MAERCCDDRCNFDPSLVRQAVRFIVTCRRNGDDPVVLAYRALRHRDDLPVYDGGQRDFGPGCADADSDEVLRVAVIVQALARGYAPGDAEGIARFACPYAVAERQQAVVTA